MFAVKTCPSERKLTASMRPVTAVKPSGANRKVPWTLMSFRMIRTDLLASVRAGSRSYYGVRGADG